MRVEVEHHRVVERSVGDVFASLAALGTPGDTLWPAPSMPFVRSEGPLEVGVTKERHGIIRAVLDDLAPNQRIIWRATVSFLEGTHGFRVRELSSTSTRVSHELDVDLSWWFVPAWYAGMAGAHDRIVTKLLARLDGAG